MDKVGLYDLGQFPVDLDKNINGQLFLSGQVAGAMKIYSEYGELVMRSVGLPASNPNSAASVNNQKNTSLSINGSIVTVKANLSKLIAYASDAPSQGTAKWVGLLIDTGVEDIKTVNYNGTALTDADAAEAALVGGGPGSFVLWIKAEEVAASPKVISLTGALTLNMTIKVEDVKRGC